MWRDFAVEMNEGEASSPKTEPDEADAAICAVNGPSPQPMSSIRSFGWTARYDRTVDVSFGTNDAAAE